MRASASAVKVTRHCETRLREDARYLWCTIFLRLDLLRAQREAELPQILCVWQISARSQIFVSKLAEDVDAILRRLDSCDEACLEHSSRSS